MADMKKACNDLIIINLYSDYDCGKNFNLPHARCIRDPGYIQLIGTLRFFFKLPSHAKPGILGQKIEEFFCLVKFMFSKEATKIDGIFTIDLTFTI